MDTNDLSTNDCLVNPDLTRLIIRRRLQDGRLPYGRVAEVVDIEGDDSMCAACGAIVTSDHMAIEGLARRSAREPFTFTRSASESGITRDTRFRCGSSSSRRTSP